MSSNRIFISAGELSGDIHGGKLITSIRNRQKDVCISAIGGDNMSAAGAALLYHIRDTSFMGFAEVVRHLPLIYRLWKKTLRYIDETEPDLVVLIDYPGFNLRLAKAVSKRKIPVVYYISPQVWAWHQSRVRKIKKYIRQVICILPFEESWLKERGVNANFVGHPLKDRLEEVGGQAQNVRPDDAEMLIGLFPGSRRQEVDRHLPVMLASVRELKTRHPGLRVAVAMAPDIEVAPAIVKDNEKWIHWLTGSNEAIMQSADLLIMSSGTATLEAALFHTPLLVIYKLSNISFQLGKRLVKVPYISLANLIGNKKGVTELVQHAANRKNIVDEAERIISDSAYREKMVEFLREVDQRLGPPGCSDRAAEMILQYL